MNGSPSHLLTRSLACALLATLIPPIVITDAVAGSPRVRFDVPQVLACRDVTPPGFAGTESAERLLEIRLQVSSLIASGNENDLIQFLYRFESPQRSLQVVDYLPKTTMTTDLAGNVNIERKDESSKGLGLAVTGSFEYLIKATGSGDISAKKSSSVRYELLPSMKLLSSSGTVERGSGAYFKLKPSNRESLEGGKEFVVIARAPADWRGDIMHVSCRAAGVRRGVVSQLDRTTISGSSDFLVALYLEGDEAARLAASRLARAEPALRQAAGRHRKAIRKRALPTVAHKLAASVDVVQPKIPSDWLDRLLYSPKSAVGAGYRKQLPREVGAAVTEFLAAKQRLIQINGNDRRIAERTVGGQ